MAGEAKTNAFMLGTATIMLGAMADLMNLTEENSIGLVKNVVVQTTPGFTDLTQGVKNSLVYSVMTSNESSVTGEVYEYTSQNLSYAAGLDGAEIKPTTAKTTVKTAVVAPVGPSTEGLKVIPVDSVTDFKANDTVFIYIAGTENVMVRKVVSIETPANSLTLDKGLPFALPIGTVVQAVNVLAIGSTDDQPFFSAKIVGKLANGDMIAILIPKVRIASGLNIGFQTENFDNMALELKVFDLVGTDPFYAAFQKVGPSQKPAKAMLLAAN